MTLNIQAVYQGGLLRPLAPLELPEGSLVNLSVVAADAKSPAGPITDEEFMRRMKACKSLHEWFELTKLLPPDDGGYDIVKALDENRRWSGERPLLPAEPGQP
jgi:predicted DNA-binding antitoxin AbrB/MazE fold protein